MSKKKSDMKGVSTPGWRKTLLLIAMCAGMSLLVLSASGALVVILVVYFNFRWPLAVIAVFITSGTLIFILPPISNMFYSQKH